MHCHNKEDACEYSHTTKKINILKHSHVGDNVAGVVVTLIVVVVFRCVVATGVESERNILPYYI